MNPCYVRSEEENRRKLGLDSEEVALNLRDNTDLQGRGLDFTHSFLSDWCRGSFPNLPAKAVTAVVGHLTSPAVMCHVARSLAVEDLALSAQFPVPEDVLQTTFYAVIEALHESSGAERTGSFLRVKSPPSPSSTRPSHYVTFIWQQFLSKVACNECIWKVIEQLQRYRSDNVR